VQASPLVNSIAEGDLVRSTNDMYKEYGVGRVQKMRNGLAKIEFNPSVFMEPPYRSENKILPLPEIEKVDTPLDRAARGEWEPAWRFELKMLAARLLTGNKGGQLSNARTEILPHQIFTAHRVVSSPRRRFLLADEVGLGKTIEAGMIWQALHQRGIGAVHVSLVPVCDRGRLVIGALAQPDLNALRDEVVEIRGAAAERGLDLGPGGFDGSVERCRRPASSWQVVSRTYAVGGRGPRSRSTMPSVSSSRNLSVRTRSLMPGMPARS